MADAEGSLLYAVATVRRSRFESSRCVSSGGSCSGVLIAGGPTGVSEAGAVLEWVDELCPCAYAGGLGGKGGGVFREEDESASPVRRFPAA